MSIIPQMNEPMNKWINKFIIVEKAILWLQIKSIQLKCKYDRGIIIKTLELQNWFKNIYYIMRLKLETIYFSFPKHEQMLMGRKIDKKLKDFSYRATEKKV